MESISTVAVLKGATSDSRPGYILGFSHFWLLLLHVMIVRSTATTTYEKSYVSVFCKVWLWWIIKQKSIKPPCPLNLLAESFNQVVLLALLLCFQMGYVSWVWCVPHQQAWTCERHGQTCQKPSGQSKLYSVNQNKVKKTKTNKP